MFHNFGEQVRWRFFHTSLLLTLYYLLITIIFGPGLVTVKFLLHLSWIDGSDFTQLPVEAFATFVYVTSAPLIQH